MPDLAVVQTVHADRLSSSVGDRLWWIDAILIVVFCGVVLLGWLEYRGSEDKTDDAGKQRISDGLRAAASAGLTVVGILLPTTLIGVQLSASVKAGNTTLLTDAAATDLFIASWWLLASIAGGLYVMFVAATRGVNQNLHRRPEVGIGYALQLSALFAAGTRVVLAISEIAAQVVEH